MPPKHVLRQTVKDEAEVVSTVVVLDAALEAHRTGGLDQLLRRRAGGLGWVVRHLLQPVLGTAGDALPAERRHAAALELLLQWGITQLRPDHVLDLAITDRRAWLEQTSWRPAIAVMCQYGFVRIPDFRDRYYRRPDESPADNLCGLWDVAPSTFYRYLEQGKRRLARLMHEQRLDQRHALSLRAFVTGEAYRRKGLHTAEQRAAWHQGQVKNALESGDHLSALWHLRMAQRFDELSKCILRYIVELANRPELDLLLRALSSDPMTPHDRVDLYLAEAGIYQMRHDPDRACEAYERAVRVAAEARSDYDLGVVYQHLGKFFETRDADRAFAYYRDSIELLTPIIEQTANGIEQPLVSEYASTLAKLAWQYVLRNDPRAEALLRRAEHWSKRIPRDDALTGLIAQVWGEYHRRAGNIELALEHAFRALTTYERIDDLQGSVVAFTNLGLIYEGLRRYESAIEYHSRVLALAEKFAIDPYVVANTELNLGTCFYWLHRYDQAIAHYRLALQMGESAGLNLVVARSHFNLAEAHYARFKALGDAEDERRGDEHVRRGIEAYTRENYLDYAEQLARLKSEVLSGSPKHRTADRLLEPEAAAHYAEMAEIEKQRAVLAMPGRAEDHIRAHLAIANAYLAIGAKEREQALALCEKHGLHDRFAAELEQLYATFMRGLTREQRLSEAWRRAAGELLSDERRAKVLRHLLQHGSINKSAYAQVCSLGLATASKHLVHLAGLGLLEQIGRGPSTRYVLPANA